MISYGNKSSNLIRNDFLLFNFQIQKWIYAQNQMQTLKYTIYIFHYLINLSDSCKKKKIIIIHKRHFKKDTHNHIYLDGKFVYIDKFHKDKESSELLKSSILKLITSKYINK